MLQKYFYSDDSKPYTELWCESKGSVRLDKAILFQISFAIVPYTIPLNSVRNMIKKGVISGFHDKKEEQSCIVIVFNKNYL